MNWINQLRFASAQPRVLNLIVRHDFQSMLQSMVEDPSNSRST
jgi:hypothetical protein